jgi:stalled ribosome rescue protein Dom34
LTDKEKVNKGIPMVSNQGAYRAMAFLKDLCTGQKKVVTFVLNEDNGQVKVISDNGVSEIEIIYKNKERKDRKRIHREIFE